EQRDHLRIDDVQVGLAGHFIDASDSEVESLLQVDRGQGIAPKQLVDRYARRVLRGSGGQYFEDRLFGRGDRRKPSERAVRIKQGPVSRAGCLYRQDFAEHDIMGGNGNDIANLAIEACESSLKDGRIADIPGPSADLELLLGSDWSR